MSGSARYTVAGGARVEAEIATHMDRLANTLRQSMRASEYRAVLLIGGYGRGEGGVVCHDGVERPHNNFDLLVVTKGLASALRGRLVARLRAAVEPLIRDIGIGIDIGTVSETGLCRAPCKVMWYDMLEGHKTLLGDAGFVPSLTRFQCEKIDPRDVRDLMINRGTLLLINELLLYAPQLDPETRRTIVKHAMKAVIGYGDAVLFFRGAYHWSYREKQRRMAAQQDVAQDFRERYDAAIRFRFRPDYEAYVGRDLRVFNRGLLEILAPFHLDCERRRLGIPDLSWADYESAALDDALKCAGPFRAKLSKVLSDCVTVVRQGGLPVAAGTGSKRLPSADRAALAYSKIAFPRHWLPSNPPAGEKTWMMSGAAKPLALRSYLNSWGLDCDANFHLMAARSGLEL